MRSGRLPDPILERIESELLEDRRHVKWALLAALLFHALLLAVTFPQLGANPREYRRLSKSKVFLVQQARFKPPPKPVGAPQAHKPRKKRIPIPDPTPEDPEPIVIPEVDLPEIDLPEIEEGVFVSIPDGPPDGGGLGSRAVLQVGGDVEAPVGIFTPPPRYTEEARQARLEGVVLLQAIVDVEGNVTGLRVLRGLSLGLTESALETVRSWRYRPATRAGEPVPVYFNFVVRFSLQ